MFSGIVSHKAKVLKVKFHNDYMSLKIHAPKNFAKGLKKVQAYQLTEFA